MHALPELSLLDDVGELVREQPPPPGTGQLRCVLGEVHVAADRDRLGAERIGELCGLLVAMQAGALQRGISPAGCLPVSTTAWVEARWASSSEVPVTGRRMRLVIFQ